MFQFVCVEHCGCGWWLTSCKFRCRNCWQQTKKTCLTMILVTHDALLFAGNHGQWIAQYGGNNLCKQWWWCSGACICAPVSVCVYLSQFRKMSFSWTSRVNVKRLNWSGRSARGVRCVCLSTCLTFTIPMVAHLSKCFLQALCLITTHGDHLFLSLCSSWKRSLSYMTRMMRCSDSQKFGRSFPFCMTRKQGTRSSLKISRVQDHSWRSVTRIWDVNWICLRMTCGKDVWSTLTGWPKGWHSWRRTSRTAQKCFLFLLFTNSEFSAGSGLTPRTLMLPLCRTWISTLTWSMRWLCTSTDWSVQSRMPPLLETLCARWGNWMRSMQRMN